MKRNACVSVHACVCLFVSVGAGGYRVGTVTRGKSTEDKKEIERCKE